VADDPPGHSALTRRITVAIDAMGGDHGPSVTVPAALSVLSAEPGLHVILVGRREVIEPLVESSVGSLGERLTLQDATQVVTMDERPQDALRKKKDSSMRVAIDLVKANAADACVSAGNTGALMATARFVLKTVPGIDRPAILARIPSRTGHTHMLDLGANADCTAEQLFQFAVMGAVVAADLNGIDRPRVGLLNIGEEEMKGNEVVQQAASLLGQSTLNYIGFVEGTDIFTGEVDVVVTDGFTGNIALKTMEGVAAMLVGALRTEYTRNPIRRLGALASWPALKAIRQRFDTRTLNGASMVGLTGVVIKSHGGADQVAFANAIRVGLAEARKGAPTEISQLLAAQPTQQTH
jgi:glycerol-3-phosphate acyltransferase PlsX